MTREDVAASCGVPVEWVPTNHGSMTEDELVSAIEGAMMASQPPPKRSGTHADDCIKPDCFGCARITSAQDCRRCKASGGAGCLLHPPRRGDWMQTYTGRQFWPMDPRADEVHIKDIAHALGLQCRFAGHCREFYSVAEHSVRVSYAVPPEYALYGLLHDASEAYLVDVPRPLKPHLKGYAAAEDAVMEVICEWFGLNWFCRHPWEAVKIADNTLLATEARDLMTKPPVPWAAMPDPLPERIVPMSPSDAEAWFLRRFRELGGR